MASGETISYFAHAKIQHFGAKSKLPLLRFNISGDYSGLFWGDILGDVADSLGGWRGGRYFHEPNLPLLRPRNIQHANPRLLQIAANVLLKNVAKC